MKKKILFVIVMFMFFMGVVHASSINGDYKGNPIVKVIVDGNAVSSEVPAIIYNGSTLIPLRAAVDSMSSQVSWDANTYTANITTSKKNQNVSKNSILSAMKKDNINAAKWNARNVKYVINEVGAYVSVDVLATSDIDNDNNNIATASIYLKDTDADMIFVNYYSSNKILGFYTIYKEDVEKMLQSDPPISVNDYSKLWKWNPQILIPPYTLNDAVIELGFSDLSNMTLDAKKLALDLVEVRKTKMEATYSVQDALRDLGIPQSGTPTLNALKLAVQMISNR